MTYQITVPRFNSARRQSRSKSLATFRARALLPVKWQPAKALKVDYSPRFLLAMAVSILSSISFFWVLFLVIMAN